MDLVGEEDRAASQLEPLLGLAHDLADARHAFRHGGERDELAVGVARHQARERRLPRARRAPEHHRAHGAALDALAKRHAGRQKVLLPRELLERSRTHARRQRLRR